MNHHIVRFAAILGLCVPFLAGCGKGEKHLVPVHGTLLHLGKPVNGATICFIPEGADGEAGTEARAVTGEDGTFTLESYPGGPGARPGHYKVTVMRYTFSRDIPRKYTKFTLTPLRAEVKDGEANEPVFDLQGINYHD